MRRCLPWREARTEDLWLCRTTQCRHTTFPGSRGEKRSAFIELCSISWFEACQALMSNMMRTSKLQYSAKLTLTLFSFLENIVSNTSVLENHPLVMSQRATLPSLGGVTISLDLFLSAQKSYDVILNWRDLLKLSLAIMAFGKLTLKKGNKKVIKKNKDKKNNHSNFSSIDCLIV